jgi:hypothetical protein
LEVRVSDEVSISFFSLPEGLEGSSGGGLSFLGGMLTGSVMAV